MALIYVKNMVCPRCIASVSDTLDQLEITFTSVDLGKIRLESPLNSRQTIQLAETLKNHGFELLENGKSTLISQIKSILIERIQHSDENKSENYSSFISESLNHEYTYLSRLFSQVEGITIEKYITKLKVERIKELIFYQEKTLSEIADLLNYSSVAYLSAQFKKETGMSPSQFKKQGLGKRKGLDEV
ncbi:AraC family transcriptional regulator [Algoriphagus halophytocola]|uniref:AraC family transcriptional regulator n=1 Tax=Algoriphagus halophytocola TaxID=2991499 RepID=A0ABY6ML05_9BACT|nr:MULTISPECIES: AraC family transcriptional regulator [unclassified Algoriphagus]UZD23356.1 AraC family transcriptional regulator [Algoriphagus sp. TR-M5]WBL44651.1 AraC family transcriptional regulator [Algoriphagus sp. TR-M9]